MQEFNYRVFVIPITFQKIVVICPNQNDSDNIMKGRVILTC